MISVLIRPEHIYLFRSLRGCRSLNARKFVNAFYDDERETADDKASINRRPPVGLVGHPQTGQSRPNVLECQRFLARWTDPVSQNVKGRENDLNRLSFFVRCFDV